LGVSIREQLDELVGFVETLNQEYREGALIVVEGPRDAVALQQIGFKGKPYAYCHNSNLAKLTDRATKHSQVILLLDLDSQGRRLTGILASALQRKGIRVNLTHRRRLARITQGRISGVQELRSYSEHLS